MSFNQNDYAREHLLGNVQIDRNVLATIHGNVRRNDPDGGSNVPYFTSLTGKTLRVTYTKEVATVVTDVQVDIALTSNSFATAITTINAVDSANLQATDGGGYLVLTNLNPGKTHRLEINPYTITPANDAAAVLGFLTTPVPGSISYVNEIASAPGQLGENNLQGTALIAGGENLKSSAVNRALGAMLDLITNNGIDLDAPVIVFKDKQVAFTLQVATGLYYANINDDTVRIPIYDPAVGSYRPQNRYFKVFEDLGSHVPTRSMNQVSTAVGSTGFNAAQYNEDLIRDVVYGTSGINIDPSIPFSAWGSPDGHNIYDSSVPNKNKHASTAITSIVNNVIYCAGATFQTNKVQPGDPVFLTASTLTPFDHTGWFIVKKVYDETHIAVRPVSPAELTPTVANKPRSLNPASGGTLRVAVGYYLPAGNLLMVLGTGRAIASALVRMAVAVPLREAIAGDLANTNDGDLESVITALNTHLLAGNADAHPPEAIKGITTGAWADATTVSDASGTLKQTILDIVSMLASTSSSGNQGGTKKLGAQAISIGGAAPNSLTAGTLYSQLTTLLTDVQSASTAAGTSYAGGGNWADGTTNPATTVEAELDKIISDLGSSTGGTAKISGAAVGSDLAAERLDQQIADLVNNWGKLSRTNTWTALQTFANNLAAGSGLLTTLAQSVQARISTPYNPALDVTLIWESTPSSGVHTAIRFYVSTSGLLFVTQNAFYSSGDSLWHKDTTGTISTLWELRRGAIEQYAMVADTAWTTWTQISKFAVAQAVTTVNPNYDPILAVFDSDGNRRVIADHLGLPSRRVSRMSEDWIELAPGSITDGTTFRQWIFHTGGSGALSKTSFNINFPEGYAGIEMSVGNAVGQAYFLTQNSIWYPDNIPAWPHQNMILVAEWETAGLGITGVSPGITMRAGFVNGVSSTTGAWFQKFNNNANWELYVGNSGASDTIDTGIAVTTNTQRMRLEAYGSNMPGGARVLAFINGVLVAQASAHMPDLAMGFLASLNRVNSTSSTLDMGPIYITWTRPANGVRSDDAV